MRLFFYKRIQIYKKFTGTLTQKLNKIDFIAQGQIEKNEISFVRQITRYVIINVKEAISIWSQRVVNKIFNKDKLDKCLFWLFNIFFASAIIFHIAFYSFANLTTSFREFLYLNDNYVNNTNSDILTVLFFIILFGIFCFLHIVIKFTSLQLIYKRAKNKYFTKYLEKLAPSNNKSAFVTIGKMLALDAFVSVFVMLVYFLIKIKTAPCYYITDDIISAVFSQTMCYFYAVGGVTPCYIVFLIWYKFKHRKQKVW